jgi:hypothetical protein
VAGEGKRVTEHGPDLGESFTVADDMRDGDLVYWEHAADGRIFLRRMEEWQLVFVTGPVFRIERSGGPLSFALIPIR